MPASSAAMMPAGANPLSLSPAPSAAPRASPGGFSPAASGQTAIAFDDDSSPCGGALSRVTFTAASGVAYWVVVEGLAPQMALDREDAATAKRGPGRPRKLSSIGLLLARDPAASPSTPPPPSRTGRSHANWWHPASIRPILQAVPACGGYSPAVKHLKLTQPETYNNLRESTVRGWFLKGSLTQLTAEAQASLLRGFGHHHPPTAGRRATLSKYQDLQVEIKDRLLALRQGGVALNHTTARSVMLAVIQQREPHLLSSNGGALRLSAQFVRDFLENQLNWVTR
ncbi:hypothetical protein V8C86DRAFT_42846 [Haematococcus lacustris]